MKKICSIYRSSKKDGMYLYVDKTDGVDRVPGALMKQFGRPELAMTLLISAERELARVDAEKVLAGIEEQGFYLQMPPIVGDEMQAIHSKNSKIQR
jgi:uncharacterized protein YcgL (UPF0745 family)